MSQPSATESTPGPALRRKILFYAWAGWLLAATFFFYAWILRVAPSITVEPIMRDFAVGGAVVGNLSAVYFWAYAALQIPCGLFMDRWGPRRVLTIAAFATGAGAAVMGWSSSIELAYAGRALIGFGAAFAFVGSLVIAGLWFPSRRFAFFSGAAMALGLAGGVVGQGPLAAVVEALGWRDYMLLLAGWAVIHAVLTWLLVRDRPPTSTSKDRGKTAAAAAPKTPAEPMMKSLGRVLRRRQNFLIAAFAFTTSVPILAFGGLWGVPYTVARFGVDQTAAGFAMATLLLGVACGGPIWGLISDRFGRRKPPLLAGATLGLAALLAAIYLPGISFGAFQICVFLAGFGGACMATAYALGREHNDLKGSGTAMGLINMCTVLSGAVSQPVVGLLLDSFWDGKTVNGARVYGLAAYQDAFLILPASFAASIIVWLFLKETYARPYVQPQLS